MKRRSITGSMLGLAAALMLAGCGGRSSENTAPDPLSSVQSVVSEVIYENNVTQLSEGTSLRLVQIAGEKIYSAASSYDKETDTSSFSVTRISGEGNVEDVWEFSLGGGLLNARYCVRDDGSICIAASKDDMPWKLFLFDSEGQPLAEEELSAVEGPLDANDTMIPVQSDDQGRIYLLAGGKIYLFDESGSYKGMIVLKDSAAGWMLARSGDGSVYTAYLDGKKQILARLDYDTQSAVDVSPGFPDCRNNGQMIFACGDTGFWCVTDTKLMLYDWERRQEIEMFSWVNQGIRAEEVKGVMGPEEAPVILTGGMGNRKAKMYRLTPLSDEELAYLKEHGPTVIRLAGQWVPRDLETAALEFNASQKQYRVELVPYTDENDDWEEIEIAKEKLQREMVLDTSGIDMVCLQNLDVEALAKAGALEDLSPYLESSTLISREDMFEPVLQAFTMEGRLCCIPKRFTMFGISGDASDLSGRTGWTWDEFLDFADNHKESRLFGNTSFYTLFRALVSGDMFLEDRDGKLTFNENQCKRFLEVLKSLQEVPVETNEESYAVKKAAPLYWDVMYDFDIGVSRDPSKVFIGRPTADGTRGVYFEVGGVSQPCAIMSQSDCKEGAWAFYEYYLNSEDTGGGYPIFRSLFDEEADAWIHPVYTDHTMTPEGDVDVGSGFQLPETGARRGMDGIWYPLQGTQEDVDAVLAMIETGGYWITRDEQTLQTIISEEGEPYFQGQKDLDTVADIIGNRWLLYQAENG